MSAGIPMETPRAAPGILLTNPAKTFPAPHSTNSEIPRLAMKAMLSRQRTTPVTWATRSLRISSGSVTGAARTFETSATQGGLMAAGGGAAALAPAAGGHQGQG